MLKLLSGETDPGPGITECQAVLFVCLLGIIESFQKKAVCSVCASVADVRRPEKPGTNDRFISITVLSTFGACDRTGPLGTVRNRAKRFVLKYAFLLMHALAPGRFTLFLHMRLDLTADSCAVLPEILRDLGEVHVKSQILLDLQPVVISKLFHGFLLSGQDTESIVPKGRKKEWPLRPHPKG